MSVSAADFPAGTENRLSMRIGCYILFGICTCTLLVRFYVRTCIARKLGLDDYLILTSWVRTALEPPLRKETVADRATAACRGGAHCLCEVAVREWDRLAHRGFGNTTKRRDSIDSIHFVAMDNASSVLFRAWVHQGFDRSALPSARCNPAATTNPLGNVNILVGARCLIDYRKSIVVAGFLCTPLKQVWTTPSAIGGPTCINILSFNYYNAALFVISDIFLALAPLAVIRKLQMDVKKKRALAIMFSLGVLAIGGTIARQATNAIAINNTADFTWHWAPTALCSILESSLGIIFVCVPAMAPLFKNWVGGSTSAKYTPDDYQPKRPSAFSKLRSKPKLRPDDESILCETRITAMDAKDRDGAVESYEMDQHAGNFAGDSGSERRIITPPSGAGEKRVGSNKEHKNGFNRQNGVMVNTEYKIDRTNRKSVK
ncbi:uncharacterized protein PAC_11224 [Phialocephala subalpina]|uniref:Rhodopsin domain-containing protein n=1 Tax=Phialocephala subalpina TaxID=576137 RepID=A0A1L7X8H5_9HELO|nr:uncharacterized protein PAC_11224 [Phialocephala subalpina]